MQLAPCKVCGAPCKVQKRSEMGPGDYYVDRLDNPPLWPFGPHRDEKTGESLHNYWRLVECNPADGAARLSCTVCTRHSKWIQDAGQLLIELEAWQ